MPESRSTRSYTRRRVGLRPPLLAALASVLLAPARAALAHPGQPPAPHDLWSAWSLDPLVVVGLVLGAALYARGVRLLWQSAGVGHGVRGWQVAAYSGGMLSLVVALVSPLDALGQALFAAHMAQHLVLILVSAPLLVLGAPLLPLLWALPLSWRRGIGHAWLGAPPLRAAWALLSQPLIAMSLQAVALWVWHLPSLYQAALTSTWVHAAEHACFLATALLFWWTVLPHGAAHRHAYGTGMLLLFVDALFSSALGILLTFSKAAWYPAYAPYVGAWGMTLMEDQQLAGLLMWMPPAVIYVGATMALLVVWLQEGERETRRREAAGGPAGSPAGLPTTRV